MLIIQRASAGSGKTYTLTFHYILNLLANQETPDKWQLRNEKQIEESLKHILAITFTNKATNEMKERIISSLSSLSEVAHFDKIEDKLIDEIPYLKLIQKKTGASYQSIGIAAEVALKTLLNNYSLFKIATIDSFFQEILRIFAYEANISDSYQLEIDSSFILDEALDAAFHKLDMSPSSMGNSIFWLKSIMQSEARKSQLWNPFSKKISSKSVYSLIRRAFAQLENEEFKEIKNILFPFYDDQNNVSKLKMFYLSLKKKSQEERHLLWNNIRQSSDKILSLISTPAFDASKVHSNFIKHVNAASQLKFNDNIKIKFDNFINEGTVLKKKFRSPGNPLDQEAMNFYSLIQKWMHPSKDSYYKNWLVYGDLIPYLGLILEIRNFITNILNDKNIIQLHDTSFLLKKIIGDADAPFVYERLGNRINHFLIDEFQDTSQMQWDVMKPLLSEGLSKEGESLIIGDPKQSIYRFRNANHKLITEVVPATFPYHRSAGYSQEDNTNWRSATNIVKFNNYFFKTLASSLNEISCKNGMDARLNDLYSNVVQVPHNKKNKGYIEIRFFEKPEPDLLDNPNETGSEDNDSSLDWFSSMALDNLGPLVSSLIERGYKGSDIGILVNTNGNGKEVVKSLISYNESISNEKNKIDFISEEALLISSSKAVELILNVLKKISDPSLINGKSEDADKEEKSKKYYNWNKLKISYNIYAAKHQEMGMDEKIISFLETVAVENMLSELIKELASPSIATLVEMIIKTFVEKSLKKTEGIFLSAFQDLVNDYSKTHHNDVASFLDWWNTRGHKTSITSPQNTEAVQIMTIHKSKGLEFKCVILPFADDSFIPGTYKEEWKWVKPGRIEDLELPPFLPVKTNSSLKESIHENLYFEYFNQVVIDTLNMYYVAFTRARNELYIFTKEPNNKKTSSLNVLMHQILTGNITISSNIKEQEKNSLIELKDISYNEKTGTFTVGTPFSTEEIHDSEKPTDDTGKIDIHIMNDYYVNSRRPKLRVTVSRLLPSGDSES